MITNHFVNQSLVLQDGQPSMCEKFSVLSNITVCQIYVYIDQGSETIHIEHNKSKVAVYNSNLF